MDADNTGTTRAAESDVIVIGGGAAGLSAALLLGRARRSVVLIDAGEPRNAPAEGVHGLLGHDGIPPTEFLATGRAEAERYGAQIIHGRVTTVSREGARFAVVTDDGTTRLGRRVVVATGLVDRLPDLPGVWERWGKDVVHCPYCHGWEVRDRAVGVVATGPMSVHQANLFRQWTPDVTVFSHTSAPLGAEQVEELTARGIRIVEGAVVGLEIVDDRLQGVRLADGTVVAREAVAVATRMEARVDFLEPLGLRPVEHPSGMGTHLPVDPQGQTTVPGVWVAGNATDPSAQVIDSAAAGAAVARFVNADLVGEETAAALAHHREHRAAGTVPA